MKLGSVIINVGMEDEEALGLVSDLIKHAIHKRYEYLINGTSGTS
jgi:hypothetical protein